MKKKLLLFIFAIIFVISGLTAYSQPGGPPCGSPPCGGPGGNPGVPLSGIELIIAAGAAFGAKKWLDRSKKE